MFLFVGASLGAYVLLAKVVRGPRTARVIVSLACGLIATGLQALGHVAGATRSPRRGHVVPHGDDNRGAEEEWQEKALIAQNTIIEELPRHTERLWCIKKGEALLDCELVDRGMHGVDVQVSSAGNWQAAHRLASRDAAVVEAAELKVKLLRQGGLLM